MARVSIEEVRRDLEIGMAAGEQVGVSWLQRRYRIGFEAATALKVELCALGVVFPPFLANGDADVADPASLAPGGRP